MVYAATICYYYSLSILLLFSFVALFWMVCLPEVEGLKRKLTSKLGGNSAGFVPDWKVLFWFPLYSFLLIVTRFLGVDRCLKGTRSFVVACALLLMQKRSSSE